METKDYTIAGSGFYQYLPEGNLRRLRGRYDCPLLWLIIRRLVGDRELHTWESEPGKNLLFSLLDMS